MLEVKTKICFTIKKNILSHRHKFSAFVAAKKSYNIIIKHFICFTLRKLIFFIDISNEFINYMTLTVNDISNNIKMLWCNKNVPSLIIAKKKQSRRANSFFLVLVYYA